MFNKLRHQIEEYMTNECDHIIIDMMRKKLVIDVSRNGDELTWKVTFSGEVVNETTIDISTEPKKKPAPRKKR